MYIYNFIDFMEVENEEKSRIIKYEEGSAELISIPDVSTEKEHIYYSIIIIFSICFQIDN